MSTDLFGIGDVKGDDETPDYIVVSIQPADGWRAVFIGNRLLGLAAFALVEMIPKDLTQPVIPQRAIRPMVVDETGEINDVSAFEEFLCVVPPGGDIAACVVAAAAINAQNE